MEKSVTITALFFVPDAIANQIILASEQCFAPRPLLQCCSSNPGPCQDSTPMWGIYGLQGWC